MIVVRIFAIKKVGLGNRINKKVFMDNQVTGVFTKIEEVRYISGIKYKTKNNGQLYKLRGHSLYFRKKNHVFISLKTVFVIEN